MKKQISILLMAIITFLAIPTFSFAQSETKGFSNSQLVNMLPTSGLSASLPTRAIDGQNYLNINSSILNEIKSKALSLKKTNEYNTAKSICEFVKNYMSYEASFLPQGIDYAWKYGKGNCETYSLLTSTMYYYAGLPNAYVGDHTLGHSTNLVLCNGKWIKSDSQVGFDINTFAEDSNIVICFKQGGYTYSLKDLTGIKLAFVGYDLPTLAWPNNDSTSSPGYWVLDQEIVKTGIVIPRWVTGYEYNPGNDWIYFYIKDGDVDILGYAGTGAEKLANDYNYNISNIDGNKIVATSKRHSLKVLVNNKEAGSVSVSPKNKNLYYLDTGIEGYWATESAKITEGEALELRVDTNQGYKVKEIQVLSGEMNLSKVIDETYYKLAGHKIIETSMSKYDTVLKVILEPKEELLVDKTPDEKSTPGASSVSTANSNSEEKIEKTEEKESITNDEIKDEEVVLLQHGKLSSLTSSKKGLTARWNQSDEQINGYQLRYSLKKNMKSAKNVIIANRNTTKKSIRNLKSKKKYYVQLRTYRNVNGTRYYSSWSSKKSVKIK